MPGQGKELPPEAKPDFDGILPSKWTQEDKDAVGSPRSEDDENASETKSSVAQGAAEATPHSENLGEKLKSANQDTFRSLSAAWEVHIIRNKIAHEGQEFELSQHEAKRVITLYEQIFREFGFI